MISRATVKYVLYCSYFLRQSRLREWLLEFIYQPGSLGEGVFQKLVPLIWSFGQSFHLKKFKKIRLEGKLHGSEKPQKRKELRGAEKCNPGMSTLQDNRHGGRREGPKPARGGQKQGN